MTLTPNEIRERLTSDGYIEAVLSELELNGFEITGPESDEGSADDARDAFSVAAAKYFDDAPSSSQQVDEGLREIRRAVKAWVNDEPFEEPHGAGEEEFGCDADFLDYIDRILAALASQPPQQQVDDRARRWLKSNEALEIAAEAWPGEGRRPRSGLIVSLEALADALPSTPALVEAEARARKLEQSIGEVERERDMIKMDPKAEALLHKKDREILRLEAAQPPAPDLHVRERLVEEGFKAAISAFRMNAYAGDEIAMVKALQAAAGSLSSNQPPDQVQELATLWKKLLGRKPLAAAARVLDRSYARHDATLEFIASLVIVAAWNAATGHDTFSLPDDPALNEATGHSEEESNDA